MKRVVVLGRGAAGKSTFAAKLGAMTGIPVIELDKIFWKQGLVPSSREEWSEMQRKLVEKPSWILDGDLGPYDAVDVRLRAADTVILLDFPFARCAWRAVRRSREGADFWRWLVLYRRRSRPQLMQAIARYASNADFYVLRNPEAVRVFLAQREKAWS
jgi:adenylate kinase family enzyme